MKTTLDLLNKVVAMGFDREKRDLQFYIDVVVLLE